MLTPGSTLALDGRPPQPASGRFGLTPPEHPPLAARIFDVEGLDVRGETLRVTAAGRGGLSFAHRRPEAPGEPSALHFAMGVPVRIAGQRVTLAAQGPPEPVFGTGRAGLVFRGVVLRGAVGDPPRASSSCSSPSRSREPAPASRAIARSGGIG